MVRTSLWFLVCRDASGRGPVGLDIAAALARDATAEAEHRRVRAELARRQRLAEAEVRGEPDEPGRREPEQRGDEGGVRGRVEPHEHEVVALGDDVLVHLLRT